MSNEHPTPEAIMQLTRAYAGSKALVSAVELALFTTLAGGPLTGAVLRAKLGLQPRGSTDWLDALVSLGMLERDGDLYANTPATDLYLDRAKPTYVGGMVIGMAADTSHWDTLTAALQTGHPQIEGDQDFLDQYGDPASFTEFMHQMTGLSMGAAQAIAETFPWSRYRTVIDVGAAEGCLPVQLALRHPRQPSTLPEAVMVSPETFGSGSTSWRVNEHRRQQGSGSPLPRRVRTGRANRCAGRDLFTRCREPCRRTRPPAWHRGAKEVIGFSRRGQPDQCWTEQHVIAEGDLVVVYGIREGTWQGKSFRGVDTPSGRRVSVELAHMFRIENGKIAEHWAVRDDFGMFQQLGVAPAPRAPQAT